jgi:hypothetical protein
LPKLQQDDERISDGVNLLISILVRYPEVGAINYDGESQTIKMTFMLSDIPDGGEFTCLREKLLASIAAYHTLEQIKGAGIDISLSSCEQVAMLVIRRDVPTLTKGEMALVMALLRENLQGRLVIDASETILEEDLLVQEEVIVNMLENMKKQQQTSGLIGIREDGRVLVFNK